MYMHNILINIILKNINPFKPNELSNIYREDENFSKFRAAGWYLSFLFKF